MSPVRKLKRLEPHPSWVRFFSYVQSLRDGVVSRLVIQDKAPIFMEHAYENIDLTNGASSAWEKTFQIGPAVVSEYSPEWTHLVKIAADLGYCEFHELKIENGAPVSIGRLVNKEKFT